MNPWLERHWNDFQPRLLNFAADKLKPQLPRQLEVRIVARQFEEMPVEPALDWIEYPNCTTESERAKCSPIIVHLKNEDVVESFLEIRDVRSDTRVTVLEILTPAAKAGRLGSRHYGEWQKELIKLGTNLVEIDLLRAGYWVVFAPLIKEPPQHRTPYRVSIFRKAATVPVDYYPIALDSRLPAIPVPLVEDEVDLDLQEMLDGAQEFAQQPDYTQAPVPPLGFDDAAWAEGILREKGLLKSA